MSSPFSRPLFRTNFVRKYAEGGIVSTVAGPEEQGQLDPMDILNGMAHQVDTTEKNLDSAGGIDDILSSFTGTKKTAADARTELADLVGKRDAEATPDSVLALVQPAMAIMEMSRQMQPQGGIQQAPFNDAEGMPMEAGQPDVNFSQGVPAYAEGGQVDMNAILQKYAAMQKQIPQGYDADPSSAWLALAQFGAGLSSGHSFSEGMARGTEMAGPYMQRGIENQQQKRAALQAFAASETQNQEQQAFTHSENQAQIAASKDLAKLNFQNDMTMEKFKLAHPQMGETQRMAEDLSKMYEQIGTMGDDDPAKALLQKKIDSYEKVLFPADKNDPLMKYRMVVASEGGDPYDPAAVGTVIKKMETTNHDTTDMQNAARITELKAKLAQNPTDIAAKTELETLTELTANHGVNVTNNIGDRGAVALRASFEKRKQEVYTPKQVANAKQLNDIEVLKTILSIDPSKGGPYMGLGAEQFAKVGQVLESIGYTGDIPSFFRGPALSQAFQTSAADLSVEQQKDMARGTNLTLGIIQQATANIGKNPDANRLWVEMNEKVLRWQAKNDDYLSLLERTYGYDNPSILKGTDPKDPALQGIEIPKKPLSKLTEAEIFDAQGRPLLSYDDYVAWRQMHEPAVDEKMRQKIRSVARVPKKNGYPSLSDIPIPDVGSITGPSATAPATMREFNNTPGVSVDVTRPDPNAQQPTQAPPRAIQVQGYNEIFMLDPNTGLYVGTQSGRKYDTRTKQFLQSGGR